MKDPQLFMEVAIDPEIQTLACRNGADFDPATVHDWDKLADEMIQRARQRELQEVIE